MPGMQIVSIAVESAFPNVNNIEDKIGVQTFHNRTIISDFLKDRPVFFINFFSGKM